MEFSKFNVFEINGWVTLFDNTITYTWLSYVCWFWGMEFISQTLILSYIINFLSFYFCLCSKSEHNNFRTFVYAKDNSLSLCRHIYVKHAKRVILLNLAASFFPWITMSVNSLLFDTNWLGVTDMKWIDGRLSLDLNCICGLGRFVWAREAFVSMSLCHCWSCPSLDFIWSLSLICSTIYI
jgi:hypothetical protein